MPLRELHLAIGHQFDFKVLEGLTSHLYSLRERQNYRRNKRKRLDSDNCEFLSAKRRRTDIKHVKNYKLLYTKCSFYRRCRKMVIGRMNRIYRVHALLHALRA
ncbi:hypothetical protein OTU49_017079 [Cherax quadricarinatus]|uniref:Uncharacterized protein n=1 Tax=Cherax quadricarinatus TaxID=27406 RepID=A0AAW0YD25_CHEQU